jgi:hypothetical protein
MSDATKKTRKPKVVTPAQAAKIEGAFEAAMAAKRAQTRSKPQEATQASTEAPKKIGRPSKYSPAVAQEICEGLAEGIPLREICRRDHMPEWRTVYDWMGRDEALSAAIARARDIGYDKIAEECLQIADTPTLMRRVTTGTDPKTGAVVQSVVESDDVNHRRLQVDTRLKLLAKFHPKKYGDRAILAGDADNPLQINVQATEMFESILKNAEMTRQIEE